MLQRFCVIVLFAAVLATGCKKNDSRPETSTADDPDVCVQSASADNGDIIPGEYIVLYKEDAVSTNDVTAQRVAEFSGTALSRNNIRESALRKTFAGGRGGFVARLSEDEATRLRKDVSVEAVEPDRIISLGTCFTVVEPRLITWNIEKVGYGNGIGKRAWVIDTGIDFEHPDLDVDKTLSKSFLSGVASADDENGHGTHVAGIIGAKNNTFGVLGVASGATLISLRVLDKDGKGNLSNIIAALAYIRDNASPGDVVNMSVGDEEGISEILDQQVKNTAAKGLLIAIAAGNESDNANKYSPARANGTNIFTISAVDSTGKFASFSNYGNDVVDYAMPGVRILSTYLGNKYAYMSGTSMAAPHMAGLLLLRGTRINSSGTALNDPDGLPDLIAHF